MVKGLRFRVQEVQGVWNHGTCGSTNMLNVTQLSQEGCLFFKPAVQRCLTSHDQGQSYDAPGCFRAQASRNKKAAPMQCKCIAFPDMDF